MNELKYRIFYLGYTLVLVLLLLLYYGTEVNFCIFETFIPGIDFICKSPFDIYTIFFNTIFLVLFCILFFISIISIIFMLLPILTRYKFLQLLRFILKKAVLMLISLFLFFTFVLKYFWFLVLYDYTVSISHFDIFLEYQYVSYVNFMLTFILVNFFVYFVIFSIECINIIFYYKLKNNNLNKYISWFVLLFIFFFNIDILLSVLFICCFFLIKQFYKFYIIIYNNYVRLVEW